jgi:Flp pilus assembly CpaF family ATPase
VWINEPSRVFIAREGRHELTTTILTADQVRDLVERMLKTSHRRVDLSSPFGKFIKGHQGSLRGVRRDRCVGALGIRRSASMPC